MSEKAALSIDEHDHALGPEGARIAMVMYGDYQCPHTVKAHPVVAQLREKLGDDLRFVFRHFPLSHLHPRAQIGAEAAEAAAVQGQFWAMHDYLLTHPGKLGDEDLLSAAGDVGLDRKRFVREMRERTHADRVKQGHEQASRAGVHSTPTFVVNGQLHDGHYDFDTLLGLIERVMSRG